MPFSYEMFYQLYQNFFDNEWLSDILLGIKFFAIAFILINIWSHLVDSTQENKITFPIKINRLLASVIMVLILASYNHVLNFLDQLLIGFDEYFNNSYPNYEYFVKDDVTEVVDDNNWEDKMKEMSYGVLDFLKNPIYLISNIIYYILWLIDCAVYGVFLLERFFFIGVLKLLGAIAICMAVFEKFRDLFYKWLKLYIALYLLIIPFFLIIAFGHYLDELTKDILKILPVNVMLLQADFYRSIVLLIIVWLKFRLFKRSYDLVYKIFVS
ncbi:hypothetical protein [Aureivirga sp. CE67]|uniref:hypothetical protein n=1 Tax=Aureivirga sp. CE67 TaxID=1788983 RepID=UPI0018CAB20F|nr:hypothetical protein [Aureivirga sp. CE67]